MKLLLSLVCLLSSFSAFADISVSAVEGISSTQKNDGIQTQVLAESYYERLNQFFNEGSSTFFLTNVDGLYAGRCYFASEPNSAIGALLAIRRNTTTARFPMVQEDRKIVAMWETINNPQFFDVLDQSKLNQVNSFFAAHQALVTSPVFANDAVEVHYGTSIWHIRYSRGMLINQLVDSHNGKIVATCYYNRKVSE